MQSRCNKTIDDKKAANETSKIVWGERGDGSAGGRTGGKKVVVLQLNRF